MLWKCSFNKYPHDHVHSLIKATSKKPVNAEYHYGLGYFPGSCGGRNRLYSSHSM